MLCSAKVSELRHNEMHISRFATSDDRDRRSISQTTTCWRRNEINTKATDIAIDIPPKATKNAFPEQKPERVMIIDNTRDENDVRCHDRDVRSG